jgi:hypothetical protein
MGALSGHDIRLGKIVTFVEKGSACQLGAGVGEAIAEIQRRGMSSFSEAIKGLNR